MYRMLRPQNHAQVDPRKKTVSMPNNTVQNLDIKKRISIPRRLRPPRCHKKDISIPKKDAPQDKCYRASAMGCDRALGGGGGGVASKLQRELRRGCSYTV